MFSAMVAGWETQQKSRHLAAGTIEPRLKLVKRFTEFCNEYPWAWRPSDLEEWTVSLVSEPNRLAYSTVRLYQQTIAQFCTYLTDRRYDWTKVCMQYFDTHPVQICHEWNTLSHTAEYEGRPGRRPMTRQELQAFLDYADDQVGQAIEWRRKGWVSAARDAALFKLIYAWGLRRKEAAMLDVGDFSTNPRAPELGRYGMLSVRWGKASKGGPPRRRNVCTVMPWAVDVISEYVHEIRPLYDNRDRQSALWLTERGSRISVSQVNERFNIYRDAIGLPSELGPHCLRHSYVTHLIEDGMDPLFVQQQVGHAWASTTAIYTGVSNDFKNRVLRDALDRAFQKGDGHGNG